MDVVEINRMEKAWNRHGDKLSRRILSDGEMAYSAGFAPGRMVEFLAGRFAAKEAIAKAVGCGLAKLQMPCVTVALGHTGLEVSWDLQRTLGPVNPGSPTTSDVQPPWPTDAVWHVSISHAAGLAVAMAILEWV